MVKIGKFVNQALFTLCVIAGASLPYFNPHSFRKTLAQLGEKVCRTPEQFKAWSQNLSGQGVENQRKTLGSNLIAGLLSCYCGIERAELTALPFTGRGDCLVGHSGARGSVSQKFKNLFDKCIGRLS